MAHGGTIKIDTGAVLRDVIKEEEVKRARDMDVLVKSIVDNLSKASNGKNLINFWKTQEDLVEDVVKSCKEFNKTLDGDSASNLLKNVNALKAVHGVDLSDILPDFNSIEKAIEGAKKIAGSLDSAFDVSSFESAFSVFDSLVQNGADVRDIFANLSAGSDVGKLVSDLDSANNTILQLKGQANRLKEDLAESKDVSGLSVLEEECEDLRYELQIVREEAERTFRNFLRNNNIDIHDDKFEKYFENIRNGSITARDAIADFKRDYAYLLENNTSFDTGQLQDFSERLDNVLDRIGAVQSKLEDISSNGVKVTGGTSSGELEEFTNVIDEIERSNAGSASFAIYESLSQVLTTLKELGSLDSGNLSNVYGTIRNLAKLNDVKINKASLDNLAECIERICKIGNTSALANLSTLDLARFNDLHISKASLNNLAEYLPQIADINVDQLIKLSKIDFSNLNNLQIEKNALDNLRQFAAGIRETFLGNDTDINSVVGIGKAAGDAVQAKKDFATANEGVQNSVADSKSPLQLEAELMDRIAKSAREAADAKREFVDANRKVADSANDSNSSGITGASQDNSATIIDQQDKIQEELRETAQEAEKTQTQLADTAIIDVIKQTGKALDENIEKWTILRQVGNVGDEHFSATFRRNDGQTENWYFNRNENGNYDSSNTIRVATTDYQRFERTIISADNALRDLEERRSNILKNNPKASTSGIDGQIEYQKNYISLLERTLKSIKEQNETLLFGVQIENARAEAAKEYALAKDTKADETAAKEEAKAIEDRLRKLQSEINSYDTQVTNFSGRQIQSRPYIDNVNALKSAISQLQELKNRLATSEGSISKEDEDSITRYKDHIDELILSLKNMSAAQKGSTEQGRLKLMNDVGNYMSRNTRMSKEFRNELKILYDQLKNGDASTNTDEVRAKFEELKGKIRESGQEGKRFFDVFRNSVINKFAYQLATYYFSMYDFIRYGRQVIENVIEIDTALTELRKVSDATDQRLSENFKNSAKTAQELGSTISDVISATSDWARMGYSVDQSEELARVSVLYTNVGDGISIEDANESLISTLQGFQLDTSEAESIIDKFNEVICSLPAYFKMLYMNRLQLNLSVLLSNCWKTLKLTYQIRWC